MLPNGGDWRSKSLALLLMVSTILDGFYFANCVLVADADFYHSFSVGLKIFLKKLKINLVCIVFVYTFALQ